MGKVKIAITMEAEFIRELDRLVEENYFQTRSHAIGDAVRKKTRQHVVYQLYGLTEERIGSGLGL